MEVSYYASAFMQSFSMYGLTNLLLTQLIVAAYSPSNPTRVYDFKSMRERHHMLNEIAWWAQQQKI